MTTAAEILKEVEQQALDRLAAAGVDREGANKDRSRVQAWAAGAEVGEISALGKLSREEYAELERVARQFLAPHSFDGYGTDHPPSLLLGIGTFQKIMAELKEDMSAQEAVLEAELEAKKVRNARLEAEKRRLEAALLAMDAGESTSASEPCSDFYLRQELLAELHGLVASEQIEREREAAAADADSDFISDEVLLGELDGLVAAQRALA